ncbi:MAG TPA: hypothetical protein VH415_09570 [Nitrososphaeraceae archaeon]
MRKNSFPSILAVFITVSVMTAVCASYVLAVSNFESEAARKSTAKKVIPFETNLNNTGCGGEPVALRGEIHFFTFVVLPQQGDLQQTTDTDFDVIDAFGLKSGKQYKLASTIINTETADTARGQSGPVENVTVSFQLNGPDEGDELFARGLKVTVNDSSQINVDDSNLKIICAKHRML